MRSILVILTCCLIGVSCEVVEEVLPGGIQFEENIQYIAFCPEEGATTGFIYYPGALVPPEAYNSWMEEISRAGYCAIIAKMPLNLAFLDVTAAQKIKGKFPDVDNWVIGGHSLGGAMAVQLIADNPNADLFEGLILTGSYPSTDISFYTGNILSLYGGNDGISTPEEIDAGRQFLPPGTDIDSPDDFSDSERVYYHLIEGGNHAQFGNYGPQSGDGVAAISAEVQQAEMVEYITAFFEASGL